MDVDVRCFGDQNFHEGRLKVKGYELDPSKFTCPKPLQSVFGAMQRDIDFNTTNVDADPKMLAARRALRAICLNLPRRSAACGRPPLQGEAGDKPVALWRITKV